jgi:poly(3-hydroxybutyrate) depolymerase
MKRCSSSNDRRVFCFSVSACCMFRIATAAMFLFASISYAADWPPTLDKANVTTKANDGRIIERYIHGSRAQWGYAVSSNAGWGYPAAQETGAAEQNHNSFYVVSPKAPHENAPLYVVLHSANRTAYDYLGYAALDRKIDEGNDPATAMTNVPEGFYGLYLNSTNAEWWGWTQARQNSAKHIETPPSAELRVLDTIEWVVQRYKIDRNRIYLSGVSMGGNGALGIGIHHGDIFAAMRVTVPAGTGFASYSMGSFAPSPDVTATQTERAAWIAKASGVGIPDPPVMVDFSSPVDSWSMTQPALVQAAEAGRLPLILSWGPFGHTTFASAIAKSPLCAIALAFPWLEIRKNEAYPVFTHASSDQQSPWLRGPADFDESGQMNAYFRWKDEVDNPREFSVLLWMEHPPVKNSPSSMPDHATSNVTLRRLQHFETVAGKAYLWKLSQDGHLLASGVAKSDATDLLTIPSVLLTTQPTELFVTLK